MYTKIEKHACRSLLYTGHNAWSLQMSKYGKRSTEMFFQRKRRITLSTLKLSTVLRPWEVVNVDPISCVCVYIYSKKQFVKRVICQQ